MLGARMRQEKLRKGKKKKRRNRRLMILPAASSAGNFDLIQIMKVYL